MRHARPRRDRRGFTLMEVLLVLAILVILGSLAAMSLSGVMGNANRDSAKAQIGLFKSPVERFFINTNQYPTSLEDLVQQPSDAALAGRWQGPYMDPPLPLDPWKRPYQYVAPGKHNASSYDIWSLGPDGQDGTADDIGNWVTQTQ